jgi:predicted nuclease of predicted toxin-antitoxin system
MAEIRYHLDEHLDTAVVVGLRRRGIDVTTTVETGLMRASDPEQLAFALTGQRVFVTRDRRILATTGQNASHAGIVIARTGRGAIGPTVLALTHLHRTSTAEEMMSRIEYL